MKSHSGSRADLKTPARLSASPVRVVFLVGFMGAGKTSVGKALSQDLGWPFEDLDDRLESREGRTVEQIFRESGEQAFRRAETAALRELLDELGPAPKIVALGGGAFVQRENAEFLERADVTSVFLDGPVEELADLLSLHVHRGEDDVTRRLVRELDDALAEVGVDDLDSCLFQLGVEVALLGEH